MYTQPTQEHPPGLVDRMAFLLSTVEKEWSSLPPYFEVMRQQLIGAVKETDTGVVAVIERINAVHGLSNEQIERIQESMNQCTMMVGVTRQQAGYNQQVVVIVQAEMKSQLDELNNNIERILGLSNEVGELQTIVEVITDIAGQSHLLAINAAIQATHAGAAGAAFSVVASEVKILSRKTAEAAKKIAQKIDNLSQRMALELATTKKALAVKLSATNLKKLIQDIGTIEARFEATSDGLLKMMDNIQTNNNDVVSQLTEALGYIQFQDVVRQRVEQVEKALQELSEHSRLMIGNLSNESWDGTLQPTLKERLKHHVSSYVMTSQRNTHATVFGGHATVNSEGPAIELF